MSEDRLRELFRDLSDGLPPSDAAGAAWRRASRHRRRRAVAGVTAACVATVGVLTLAGSGVLPLFGGPGEGSGGVMGGPPTTDKPTDKPTIQAPAPLAPGLPCAASYDLEPARSLEHMVVEGGSVGGDAEPHEVIVAGTITGVEQLSRRKVAVEIEIVNSLRTDVAVKESRIRLGIDAGGTYNDAKSTPVCPIETWRVELPAGTPVVVFGNVETEGDVPLVSPDPRGFVLEGPDGLIGAWDYLPFGTDEAEEFKTVDDLAAAIGRIIDDGASR